MLPLENATGDSANDYLAAGVADSLVTSLASLPTVTVLSRTAVEDARGRRRTPGDIARDLGATFVVDGTVQRAGTQLRLGLNLLRPDASVAWSEAVEGPANGVFGMQARLAAALGSALSGQMSATDRARLNTPPTSNADALDAYWRGRAMLERRDAPGNLQRAVVAFNEALRLDARFPDAFGALGEAYWELYNATRDAKWADLAVQSGRSALVVAPDQPSVRLALARTLVDSGRNAEAIDELQRALARQPNNDEARRQLGRALAASGRLDEAVAEWRKAIGSRPNNWQAYGDMGRALYQGARYAEAREVLALLTKLQPDNLIGLQMLGTVYHALGDTDAALATYERATAIAPAAQVLSNIGTIYYQRGAYRQARDAYRRALELRPKSAQTHRNLGDSLARLGEAAEARKAYRTAADLVEAELAINPTSAINLASLAVYLQKAGDGAAATTRLGEALRQGPSDVQVWYRAAVVHAQAGRSEQALSALDRALQLGYNRAQAAADEDFEPLRTHPRFARLVGL